MSSRLSFLGAAILSACAAQGEPTRKPSDPNQEVAAVTQHFSDATLRQIDATESLPEEHTIASLLDALDAKLRSTYSYSGWGPSGTKTCITTPTGKRLAVSIHGNGQVVNVNADGDFRSGGAAAGILQINPREFLREMRLYEEDVTHSATGDIASSAKPALWKDRAAQYRDPIDFHFADSGYAYGNIDLSKVFEAFGLPPEMDAREKARIILTTLNEQL